MKMTDNCRVIFDCPIDQLRDALRAFEFAIQNSRFDDDISLIGIGYHRWIVRKNKSSYSVRPHLQSSGLSARVDEKWTDILIRGHDVCTRKGANIPPNALVYKNNTPAFWIGDMGDSGITSPHLLLTMLVAMNIGILQGQTPTE